MRFLIISQYYHPEIGAPQIRLRSLAQYLRRSGHAVEVLTAMPNYPSRKIVPSYRGRFYVKEIIDDVVVHRVWLYAALGSGIGRVLNYATFTFSALITLVCCERPDYVFVESPPLFLSITGFIASRIWRAKMIFNVADLWPDSIRELGILRDGLLLRSSELLEQWSYRVAFKVNAVTEGIQLTLTREKNVSSKKVLFLPNGVDTKLFCVSESDNDLARSLGVEGKKVVLFAGTLGYAQGIDVVLEAAELLTSRADILFVFIGDGSDKPRLVEETKARRLRNILFLDPAPPVYVARLYSISLAGLATLRKVPLFDGARPSKILAAMACAVPVIYSGAGEGAKFIELAAAGIVVPPEEALALTEAVMRLSDNPLLAREYGVNGRKFVEKNFSWEKVTQDWLQHLEPNGR